MPALLALHSLALPFRTFRTSEISAEHPSPKLLLELVLLAALPQSFHVFPLFFADARTLRCCPAIQLLQFVHLTESFMFVIVCLLPILLFQYPQ